MEEFANTSSRRASKESVCCPAWTPIPMLSPVLSMSLLLASPIHLRKPQGFLCQHLILVAVAEMMCPLEFLVTPERNAEEEKLVGERKIPLNWEEKGDFFL